MKSMAIEPMSVASLRPHPGNARTHSKKQVRQIADSIREFGFNNPVLIGEDGEIIAGHGRVEAAKLLGLDSVPTVRLAHLSAAQRRAYVVADNKLALNAGWDRELLAIELQGLIELDFDVEVTGFSSAEIDIVLDEAREGSPGSSTEAEDQVPFPIGDPAAAVTRAGDVWCLGRHRLICGDARDQAVFDRLMGDERADLMFTDPPYNLPLNGHVTGLGRIRHREFAMGVGEMSAEAFTSFLQQTLGHAAARARNGAVAFVCMDWRHIGELLKAGQAVFSELKNLCVWNKTNGGMGTFYRSKHELVFVFKIGTAAHTNTFGLSPQRLGLCRGQPVAIRAERRLGDASHRQAGGIGRRGDQGLLPARRNRARSVWRVRHDPDRGREDRSPRAADRVRPGLLRHHPAPV